ncbi:hypothetical protein KY289_035714 [Solanum tuberosum]|nr:hypothetical protein KY289_035714 [Solanum tuberosum]
MIRSRVNNNIILSDVVGCLCGISDLESVGSKWKKRDIHILTDLEDMTIKARITLWEDHGESFTPMYIPTTSDPDIVIVTATTLKEFRGELTFATTIASKIYGANASNVPIAQAMFENRMTVAELVDSDWSSDIELNLQMVSTHARSATNNATYRWLCKQAINIVATTYIQRNTNVLRTHRFKIHIKVTDNGGTTTLVLFNGVAEKLLDTSAHKLVN